MGVINSIVDDVAEVTESDATESDDHESPYLPNDGAIDPFLHGFNTEHFRLDEETTDRALSVAVVLSNLFI